MTKSVLNKLFVLCCGVALCSVGANAQARPQQSAPPSGAPLRPRPVTNVSVDGSEAMFTTMCALLAAGFESDVSSANWHPLRAQLRDRMRQQQGPAVDAVREFYKKHQLADEGAMLSQYVWFGLVSGAAPKFEPTLRRDDLPPEVGAAPPAIQTASEIRTLAEVERDYIAAAWRALGGNRAKAAEKLGIGAATLHRKLKQERQ